MARSDAKGPPGYYIYKLMLHEAYITTVCGPLRTLLFHRWTLPPASMEWNPARLARVLLISTARNMHSHHSINKVKLSPTFNDH